MVKREPITEDEQSIISWLVVLRTMMFQNLDALPADLHYLGPADLLLRHGGWFNPIPLPEIGMRGRVKECFRNAALASARYGLRYIEGFAMGIIPVHHAWCADDEGNAIEVTWPEDIIPGAAYFGMEFDPEMVLHGAVLFNPYYRSLLEKPYQR
jgi:hypothetical protein